MEARLQTAAMPKEAPRLFDQARIGMNSSRPQRPVNNISLLREYNSLSGEYFHEGVDRTRCDGAPPKDTNVDRGNIISTPRARAAVTVVAFHTDTSAAAADPPH
jgi:hypothetical protein